MSIGSPWSTEIASVTVKCVEELVISFLPVVNKPEPVLRRIICVFLFRLNIESLTVLEGDLVCAVLSSCLCQTEGRVIAEIAPPAASH